MSNPMREFESVVHGGSVRRTVERLRLIGIALLASHLLSGCAMTVPMPGLSLDDETTGTIKHPAASPFSAEMDGEDWRRAKSALDTALDPQGNGAQVAWDNPKSGAKGSFVPLAQPFPKDDGICRVFTARVQVQGQTAQTLRSSACRRNGGEWIVGKVSPVQTQAAKIAVPLKNLAERDTSTHLN